MKFDLPIKPFSVANAPELLHNHVRVTVDYDKRVTGPVAVLQAIQVDPPENGFSSFKMVIFASPSARVVVERGWKTNNKKRVQAAFDQVVAEIAGKRGETYAALQKLLTEAGSELAVPAKEPPSWDATLLQLHGTLADDVPA